MNNDVTDRRWVGVHAHTYGDLNMLIVRVEPLLNDLKRLGRPAFFIRHWARGPHLVILLQLLGEETRLPAALETMVLERLKVLTADLPERPDAGTLASAAQLYPKLADLEQYPGLVWPPLPDGHVYLAPRIRALGVRDGQVAANLMDDAAMALNGTLLGMLRETSGQGPLLNLCFDLMVTMADRTAPDTTLRQGFVSYRSHAEIFLIDVPDSVRQNFDATYARQRALLQRRLHAVLSGEALTGGARASGWLRTWRAVLGDVHAAAWRAIDQGQIDLSWEGQGFSLETEEMKPALERSRRSEFHRVELANFEHLRLRSHDLSFNAYRLMTNAQYLQFNRLGLTPVQRSLLCHLVSNAVEDHLGVTAVDLASRYSYLPGAVQ